VSATNADSVTLVALLLRPHEEARNPVSRFFAAFNRGFTWLTERYARGVGRAIRFSWLVLIVLALITGLTIELQRFLPSTFVPLEDQGYFVAAFRLPEGATQARARAMAESAIAEILKVPGIDSVTTVGGYDLLSQTLNSNTFAMFVVLKPWNQRRARDLQLFPILGRVNQVVGRYVGAMAFAFPLPPIPGLGVVNGFQYMLEDRNGSGAIGPLQRAVQGIFGAASKQPAIASVSTSFSTTVPQINVDVDRNKAGVLGVPVSSVLGDLGEYLGGLEINNVTLFGRVYKTMLQIDPRYATNPASIGALWVRGAAGNMVPLSTLVKITPGTGPNLITRYNTYYAVEVDGQAPFGASSARAISAMEAVSRTALPAGYGFEWTGLALQEEEAGSTQALIFVLALVLVFLLLAALYESWNIPLSVIMGVPLAAFGSLLAVFLRAIFLRDVLSDVYVQIGLIMLVGLAAKNAILIVEFAKVKHEEEHMPVVDAAIAGARLRFRPIIMTSLTFIVAALSLVFATGPGANSRHSLGTGVVGGMSMATVLGVFFIPVLYVLVAGGLRRPARRPPADAAPAPPPDSAHATDARDDGAPDVGRAPS
jgi:hydrophobe/amphiphile efflux-1 (HAE1) family protein